MQKHKHPAYPALKYGGEKVKSWSVDFDYTNEIQAPLMQTFNYTPSSDDSQLDFGFDFFSEPDFELLERQLNEDYNEGQYYIQEDRKGPLYLFPAQCMK